MYTVNITRTARVSAETIEECAALVAEHAQRRTAPYFYQMTGSLRGAPILDACGFTAAWVSYNGTVEVVA